jgi:hypothetical protein
MALAAEPQRRQLFNGRDLSGWEMAGPGSFTVEDGALKTQGGMGLLWYTGATFGNCVLRAVYKVSRVEDNSGVFVRIADRPPDPWFAVHHGYEVQIYDADDDFHRTGCIYSLSQTLAYTQKPPGEWNVMEIALRGEIVEVTLNGTLVTVFDPAGPLPDRQFGYEPERGPRPQEGYIGLQNHDDGSSVYFRELSVAPLS